MQLSKVVFPAPFGPMIPRTSPCSTSKLTPARALTPPKRLLTSRTASKLMAPTLTLPRKRGREEALPSCAGLAQGLPEIAQGELAATAEEVDHAARNEDHTDGEQDTQADLGKDGARAATGQRLDDQLERNRAGHWPQHRARPANDRHQDHLDVVGDGEGVVLVDEAVPLGEDRTGDPGERRGDAKGRHLIEGRVDADDGGGLLVLTDRQQPVAEPRAQDDPGGQHRQERGAE